MKRKLLIVSVLALSVLTFALIGPDAPADDPGQAAPEPQPAETETPEDGEPLAAEPLASEPLETFEPTEKLSADSAVSFPVDI